MVKLEKIDGSDSMHVNLKLFFTQLGLADEQLVNRLSRQ